MNPEAPGWPASGARRSSWIVYIFSGLCAGIAGLMLTSNSTSADPNRTGLFIELDAILAVVIGGTSLAGGRFSLAGTLIGAFIIETMDVFVGDRHRPRARYVFKACVVIVVCLMQSRVPGLALRGVRPDRPVAPPPARRPRAPRCSTDAAPRRRRARRRRPTPTGAVMSAPRGAPRPSARPVSSSTPRWATGCCSWWHRVGGAAVRISPPGRRSSTCSARTLPHPAGRRDDVRHPQRRHRPVGRRRDGALGGDRGEPAAGPAGRRSAIPSCCSGSMLGLLVGMMISRFRDPAVHRHAGGDVPRPRPVLGDHRPVDRDRRELILAHISRKRLTSCADHRRPPRRC